MTTKRWIIVGIGGIVLVIGGIWLRHSPARRALTTGVWVGPGLGCGHGPWSGYFDEPFMEIGFRADGTVRQKFTDLGCSGTYQRDPQAAPRLTITFADIATTYDYQVVAESRLTLTDPTGTVVTYTWQPHFSCHFC